MGGKLVFLSAVLCKWISIDRISSPWEVTNTFMSSLPSTAISCASFIMKALALLSTLSSVSTVSSRNCKYHQYTICLVVSRFCLLGKFCTYIQKCFDLWLICWYPIFPYIPYHLNISQLWWNGLKYFLPWPVFKPAKIPLSQQFVFYQLIRVTHYGKASLVSPA